MNLTTWWVTRRTERETRVLKLARVRAAGRGEAVLDDVVIDRKGKEGVGA
jgi:hypothetical protein